MLRLYATNRGLPLHLVLQWSLTHVGSFESWYRGQRIAWEQIGENSFRANMRSLVICRDTNISKKGGLLFQQLTVIYIFYIRYTTFALLRSLKSGHPFTGNLVYVVSWKWIGLVYLWESFHFDLLHHKPVCFTTLPLKVFQPKRDRTPLLNKFVYSFRLQSYKTALTGRTSILIFVLWTAQCMGSAYLGYWGSRICVVFFGDFYGYS